MHHQELYMHHQELYMHHQELANLIPSTHPPPVKGNQRHVEGRHRRHADVQPVKEGAHHLRLVEPVHPERRQHVDGQDDAHRPDHKVCARQAAHVGVGHRPESRRPADDQDGRGVGRHDEHSQTEGDEEQRKVCDSDGSVLVGNHGGLSRAVHRWRTLLLSLLSISAQWETLVCHSKEYEGKKRCSLVGVN